MRELQHTARLPTPASPASAYIDSPQMSNLKFGVYGKARASTKHHATIYVNVSARLSTQLLNKVDGRKASTLEGESGLIPAGNILYYPLAWVSLLVAIGTPEVSTEYSILLLSISATEAFSSRSTA